MVQTTDELKSTQMTLDHRKGKKVQALKEVEYLHNDAKNIVEILGRRIEILSFDEAVGNNSRRTCYILAKTSSMLEADWFWTQSSVILSQLHDAGKQLDEYNISAKVVKIKNYYKLEA